MNPPSLKPILEFAAVFVVGVMNHVAGVFSYIKRPDYPRLFTASELLLKDRICRSKHHHSVYGDDVAAFLLN
jgi:hypothetical protein